MGETFLVTGANGCIGAWVVKLLRSEGVRVVAFDKDMVEHRHRLINDGELPEAQWCIGDLTVRDDVLRAAEGVTRIVHLAALQIPFCRANPSLGAAVNVTGTVNVFEAAREHGITQISQASSIAVFGTAADYPDHIIEADAERKPTTLYGVYKVATEDLAAVYWAENGVRSVGLRPHTVYGPGRDQGMTSLPSVGIAAAARRQPFHIDYGGTLDFQYVRDVAQAFIHAARVPLDGAPTLNITGHVVSVAEFVAVTRAVTGFDGITCGTDSLPVVAGADARAWVEQAGGAPPTPLRDAIAESAAMFAQADAR